MKKAAGVASAGAFVGGVTGGLVGGSMNAISTAENVLSTAGTVSTASDIANSLAGIEGKDIAFKGKKSTYKVKIQRVVLGFLRRLTLPEIILWKFSEWSDFSSMDSSALLGRSVGKIALFLTYLRTN